MSLEILPDAAATVACAPAAGAVRGRLLLNDGTTPARDYMVAIQSGTIPEAGTPRVDWPAAYARGAQTPYAETMVTADGTFVLAGLTPGRHALDVRKPGEREPLSTIDNVVVTADGTTDLGVIKLPRTGWKSMFDRKSLTGWVESKFFGKSTVRVENGSLVMDTGNDMTGVTWAGEALPRVEYEVTLQARRVAGRDFFCGLTFPVKRDPCTLILGGWGGTMVGLSCINGGDASENETSQSIVFDPERWYRVRLRVTSDRIAVWLDHKQIIDVELEGKLITIRLECEPSKPFGIATWRTTGAVRDVRIRRLD